MTRQTTDNNLLPFSAKLELRNFPLVNILYPPGQREYNAILSQFLEI
jgi:hypothetical protein